MCAAFFKRRATSGTGGRLKARSFLPCRCGTLEREVFEHAGACACEPRVEFGFYLAQRGVGMLDAPLAHASRDLLGQLVPQGFAETACHKRRLLIKRMVDASAYHQFPWLTILCKTVRHTLPIQARSAVEVRARQ
jgi:hypothetical protein